VLFTGKNAGRSARDQQTARGAREDPVKARRRSLLPVRL